MNYWATMPNVNKTDKRPNYDHIQETIAAHIQRVKIPAGTRLPSEPMLINHFRVSRTTVRKAIENLEIQGLVRKIHGKGTFVMNPEFHGVVDSFIGVEPVLNKMGIAVRNKVISRRDGDAPGWAREVFSTGPVHVICRLKTIKKKKVAIEYRVVAQSAASHISEKDLKVKMLSEILDKNPETYTVKASYTVSSRPIAQEEAEMLDVPLTTPIIVRQAVYYNQDCVPMSVGLMVFLADRVRITFDFIRPQQNMKTTLIV
jgi:DNA-binding GntR family transcriptional regulator